MDARVRAARLVCQQGVCAPLSKLTGAISGTAHRKGLALPIVASGPRPSAQMRRRTASWYSQAPLTTDAQGLQQLARSISNAHMVVFRLIGNSMANAEQLLDFPLQDGVDVATSSVSSLVRCGSFSWLRMLEFEALPIGWAFSIAGCVSDADSIEPLFCGGTSLSTSRVVCIIPKCRAALGRGDLARCPHGSTRLTD